MSNFKQVSCYLVPENRDCLTSKLTKTKKISMVSTERKKENLKVLKIKSNPKKCDLGFAQALKKSVFLRFFITEAIL